MTNRMEQFIAKVSALPPEEQEHFAMIFLKELEDEQKWDETLAVSQDQLAQRADEALREFEAGKTTPLDLSSRRKRSPMPPNAFGKPSRSCRHAFSGRWRKRMRSGSKTPLTQVCI